jgi:hypothetical protein
MIQVRQQFLWQELFLCEWMTGQNQKRHPMLLVPEINRIPLDLTD